MNRLRALSGLTVAISMSGSEDNKERGYPNWQIDRTVLQIASTLFGQGASLQFGHDWRDDGVMAAVLGFAQHVASLDSRDGQDAPQLINLLAWPDEPALNKDDLEALAPTLSVIQTTAPDVARERNDAALRAIALRQMRVKANEMCSARVCFGGQTSTYHGFLPGVIEEALIALIMRKPLFICGMLGGASMKLITVLEGKRDPADLVSAESIKTLDMHWPPNTRPIFRETLYSLGDFGVRGLSGVNGLTVEENSKLFEAQSLDVAMGFILKGLARLVTEN